MLFAATRQCVKERTLFNNIIENNNKTKESHEHKTTLYNRWGNKNENKDQQTHTNIDKDQEKRNEKNWKIIIIKFTS